MSLFSHMQIVGFLMRWLNCEILGILIVILSIFLCMYVQLVHQMQINLCPNMYFGGLTKLLISHLQVAPLFDSVHISVECWINFRQTGSAVI